MKKFFKKTEGFTLVELIVVIAILGILAGVGTVGYSGYIKKANMAADQQTIASVKNALTLASYSGTLTKDGYVILDKDGIQEEDYGKNTEIADALKAAFGDFSHLAMKYDWSDEVNADVVGILQGQESEFPTITGYIAGSTYAGNVTQLLGDAQHCTNALGGLLTKITGANSQGVYEKLLDNSDAAGLQSIMQAAGLADKDDGTKLADPDNTTNTQMSNAVLLAVANEINGVGGIGATADEIMNRWFDPSAATAELGLLSDTAINYAYMESAVNYFDDAELTKAFNDMNSAFQEADDTTDVLSSMDVFSAKLRAKTSTLDSTNRDDFTLQMMNDAAAFAGVMNAVAQVKDQYSDKDLLAQENMYTSGNIANVANSYMTAASCYSSLPAEGVPAGAVAVFYSVMEPSVYSVPAVNE